jgi:hypothetical protein
VVGAARTEAATIISTISCPFNDDGLDDSCDVTFGAGGSNGGLVFFGNMARYAFDPDFDSSEDYYLDIIFDEVLEDFTLEVTNIHSTPEEMAAKLAANFPGFVCVPIFPGSCVEFLMVPSADDAWAQDPLGTRGPDATLGYTMTISWVAATDPPYTDPKILKYDGDDLDGEYNLDITIPGSYFNSDPPPFPPCIECPPPCEECIDLLSDKPGDPGIGGRDIAFSVNTVGHQQVPEPATLALMGIGLGAVAYIARRRRRTAVR